MDFSHFTFTADSPWGRCLLSFLRGYKSRSEATERSYRGILARFFAEGKAPDAVTKRDVEDFAFAASPATWSKHADRTPTAATINKRIVVVASFYRYAASYVPEGATMPLWALSNPAMGIVRGRPERAPRGLTAEELSRLFAVIPQDTLIGIRDRAMLLLYFWTARRRSEIADLHYGDIQRASFPDGQGGMRQGWLYYFRGKGRKAVRDCQELPQPAMDAITWYLLASGRDETIGPDDPLFIAVGREEGRKGGNVRPGEHRPVSQFVIAKRMAVYAKAAGVHASLHTLRHTSARARYSAGCDIREIQQLLRHQSIGTTDIYLRSLVGVEDKGAKRLEAEYGDL